MRPIVVVALVLVTVVLLAGVAVASGVVSFADPPSTPIAAQPVPASGSTTVAVVVASAPTAAPALSQAELDAARIQQMAEESEMCDCKR